MLCPRCMYCTRGRCQEGVIGIERQTKEHFSSAPSVRTRRRCTSHACHVTAHRKICLGSLISHAFEHSCGRSAPMGAPRPSRRPHAAIGPDGLQQLELETTGAANAKKGLGYQHWLGFCPPRARSTPVRPFVGPDQLAVTPREAQLFTCGVWMWMRWCASGFGSYAATSFQFDA